MSSTLDPGHIYHTLDAAMHAASCLCSLSPAGATVYATVYGTTTGPDVDPGSGEAYRVACTAIRADKLTWAAPGAPYEAIYTITRGKP